jgi:hypothetical protein
VAAKRKDDGVSSGALAHRFDCTTRQVELFAKRGIAVKLGHGLYDGETSTRNYIRHLRANLLV